jgi:hypothetical protein
MNISNSADKQNVSLKFRLQLRKERKISTKSTEADFHEERVYKI